MAGLFRYGVSREPIHVPPEVEELVRHLRESLATGGYWGQYENFGPVSEDFLREVIGEYFETVTDSDVRQAVRSWFVTLPWEDSGSPDLPLGRWVQLWFLD